jgi:hypothetical protein
MKRILVRYLWSLSPIVVCSISASIYLFVLEPEEPTGTYDTRPEQQAALDHLGFTSLLIGVVLSGVWASCVLIHDVVGAVEKRLERKQLEAMDRDRARPGT